MQIGGKVKSQNAAKQADISKKKPPQNVQQSKEASQSIEQTKADQVDKRSSNQSQHQKSQQQNTTNTTTITSTIQEPTQQKKNELSKVANSDKNDGEKSIGKDSESNADGQAIIKKKRNKKKPAKMTDTDIMNQFMKSLHSNPEEEKAPASSNQTRKKQQSSQSQNISGANLTSNEARKQQSTQSKTIQNKAGLEYVNGLGSQNLKNSQGKLKQESSTNQLVVSSDDTQQQDEKVEASALFENAIIKNRFTQGSSRNQTNIAEEINIETLPINCQNSNSNLITRKYTEEQLVSSHPLTHHVSGQQLNIGSNSNDQESSASHDGVKQRLNNKRNQMQGASRISNNTQRNRGIGGATKVFQKSIVEMQTANTEKDSDEAIKAEPRLAAHALSQTSLNLGSAPFKVSTPFHPISIPTQVNEGQSEDEASISLQTALVGEQQLSLQKHKSIQSTPAKVLSSTLQSGKSSRQIETNIPNFQNTSQDSSNVSGQDDSKGSQKQQSYRTPPQNSKKYSNQSQYFTSNTQAASSEAQQVQIAKKTNFTSSSAHSTQHQKQDTPFDNTFASNFVPSGSGLQNTFGGVQYHPYAPQRPQQFSIETSESQNLAQQSAMLPLQSPIFVPTPSMTPPLQFSNSTPAFHPTSGKRNHYQGNNGSQKQYNGPRHYNAASNRQSWNNNGLQSARNLNSSSSSNSSNVYLQPMNISQSMQEQQQQLMSNFIANNNNTSFQNVENANIFLQDQSAYINQLPYYDNWSQQRNLNHDQVFPYIEKTHSFNMGYLTTGSPMPCFSPQQQHGYLSAQYQNLGMTSSQPEISLQPQISQQALYNYQRQNSILPPSVYQMSGGAQNPGSLVGGPQSPQYDQSQDLIFQIFNSIKSNHSMSPIPQSISPSAMNAENQISQQSDSILPSYIAVTPESNFFNLLDKDIELYCKNVQDTLNNLKPERDFVIQRIQAFANKVFVGESPSLELFGSLVTGLALETSDMDLAVTGLKIDDRYQMIIDLKNLATTLEEWQVLESIKSIETASIPVIKLKVDLKVLREMEMSERFHGDFDQRPIPEDQRYLSVDITFDDTTGPYSTASNMMSPSDASGMFETKTHLGLQSCALVQRYIKEYKYLREVAILLKKFLAIHNFNSPYYGGLSSYSTVLIIVAYMNYYGLKQNSNQSTMMMNQYGVYYSQTQGYHLNQQLIEELSPSRLLLGFLDFYANVFNPTSMGISVVDDGSFFQNMVIESANFMILDPLNLSNNTTKNSYLTRDILQMFLASFNNLKSLMYKLFDHQMKLQTTITPLQASQTATKNEQVSQIVPISVQDSGIPSSQNLEHLSTAAKVGIVENANEQTNENSGEILGQLRAMQNQEHQSNEDVATDLSQNSKYLNASGGDQQQINVSARICGGSLVVHDPNAELRYNDQNMQQIVEMNEIAEQVSDQMQELSHGYQPTHQNANADDSAHLKQQPSSLENEQEIPAQRCSILDVFFSKDGLLQDEIVAKLLISHCQRDTSILGQFSHQDMRNKVMTMTSAISDDIKNSKDGSINY